MHNYSFASAPPLSDLSCEPKDGVVLCCWWDCSQRQWEMNRRKAPRAHLPPSPSDTHRHPPTSRTPHTPIAPCGGVCRCRAPRTQPVGEGRPGNPRRSPPRAYSGPYPGRAPSTRTSPLAAPCPAQSSILPARQHQGMFTPPLVRKSESERECDPGGGVTKLASERGIGGGYRSGGQEVHHQRMRIRRLGSVLCVHPSCSSLLHFKHNARYGKINKPEKTFS